MKKLTVYKIT